MKLIQFALIHAKPKEKPFKVSDGEGLHVLVQPNRAKLWWFRYQFLGKERMISFGSFPEVSLAEARGKRKEARKLPAAGTDPSPRIFAEIKYRLLDRKARRQSGSRCRKDLCSQLSARKASTRAKA